MCAYIECVRADYCLSGKCNAVAGELLVLRYGINIFNHSPYTWNCSIKDAESLA